MKKIIITCLSLFLTASMAACNSNTANEPAPAPIDTPQPAKAEPVEITVYSGPGDAEDAWNERFGDPIKKKFPHITIKYINPRGNDAQRIDNLLASGATVDMYYESIGSYFSNLPTYKLQFDHSDLVKKYQVDLSAFEPSLIEALKANGNGELWGLPVNNNNLVLYYNKDIFDRFGVPYLKDGMTWDEIIDISKKFNRNVEGKQYIGLIVSPNHIMNMNPFSLPYVDPKTKQPTFLDKQWNETWKALLQTAFVDPAADSGYKNKIEQLNNKLPYTNEWQKTFEAAMYVHQSNLPFINQQEFSAMNYDMVSLPTFKQLPGVSGQMYPTFFTATSMSKHKDTVFQIIKFLTSEEYQTEYSKKGVMPVLKNDNLKKIYATETAYKGKNINFAATFYNKPAAIPAKTEFDPIVRSAIGAKLVDVSLGKLDLNTALRVANEEAVQKIASAQK